MKYSLVKIAEEIGVSKATVSLVINGKAKEARISAEVEKKILEFCKKVNYVPNIHAQRINRRFVSNVGFLVDQSVRIDSDNPFSDYNISAIMGGIVLGAEAENCRVSVQLYKRGMDENLVFDWLRSNEIDGLIYYGLEIPESWKNIFKSEKMSVVGINTTPDSCISSVNIDNFEASYEITSYIINSGRKNLLYLSGIDGSFVSDERKNGFLSACKERDISDYKVITARYLESEAYRIVSSYDFQKTNAIICANDDMAIGAITALHRRNIDVPGQVAVCGGDDIVTGRYITPPLTTFSNSHHRLGVEAVECVIAMAKGEKSRTVIVPHEILLRKSI